MRRQAGFCRVIRQHRRSILDELLEPRQVLRASSGGEIALDAELAS